MHSRAVDGRFDRFTEPKVPNNCLISEKFENQLKTFMNFVFFNDINIT